jgi:hypothetical protein
MKRWWYDIKVEASCGCKIVDKTFVNIGNTIPVILLWYMYIIYNPF